MTEASYTHENRARPAGRTRSFRRNGIRLAVMGGIVGLWQAAAVGTSSPASATGAECLIAAATAVCIAIIGAIKGKN